MNVLVTGATGFVGTRLCKLLLPCVDFLRVSVRRNSSDTIFDDAVETLYIEDIGQDTDWTDALKDIDTIIHLASRVHIMNDSSSDPLAAFRRVNVAGTETLARSAAAQGVRRFIFLSSVKACGEENDSVYRVEDMLTPQDPYGLSKKEAEDVLRKVSLDTGMEVTVLRPPLVYGPGVKANFYNIMQAVNLGIPLPFGGIRNLRSFVYLDNLIDAIIACVKKSSAGGKTYFVSDGEDISTPELIQRLANALGRKPRLFSIPPGVMRVAGKVLGKSRQVDRLLGSLRVDGSDFCNDFGWIAPYSLDEGLVETARWFVNREFNC